MAPSSGYEPSVKTLSSHSLTSSRQQESSKINNEKWKTSSKIKNEKSKKWKMNHWNFLNNEKWRHIFNDWTSKTDFSNFQWLIFDIVNDWCFSFFIIDFWNLICKQYITTKNNKWKIKKSQKMNNEKLVQKWKMKNWKMD